MPHTGKEIRGIKFRGDWYVYSYFCYGEYEDDKEYYSEYENHRKFYRELPVTYVYTTLPFTNSVNPGCWFPTIKMEIQ